MKTTRIVLAGMSGVMLEMIEAILASHPEFRVVGQIPAEGNIAAAIRRYRPDVLMILQPVVGSANSDTAQMFYQRPARVVTIDGAVQIAGLCVLRPHAIPLRDLSVDTLVDAIGSAEPLE